MASKMKKGKIDFEMYLESMKQMRNMGGIGEILNVRLLCADEEQAKSIEKRFRRNAEESYQKIISILSE